MQFAFTDDQNLIRETAREFLTERASIAQLRKDISRPEGHDPALWQAMTRELGWAGIALPESTGGSGLGMVELAILLEEQGRGLYGGPFLASAGIASALLLESAASEMRDAILSRLASGEASAAAAITGDSGRYGELAVAAELIERDGHALLQGHASFVLNGHTADIFVVVAHDRRAGRGGLALVAIEAGTAGLEIKKLTAMDLTRPYARLLFKDARPQAVLADGGTPCVERGLQIAQVALAAEQLGAMQAVLELTTGYTSQRVQFGRVIGSFQAIKHRLADMMVVCEAARSAVYYAACVVDEYRADRSRGAQELAEAAALVKVQCSTGFHEVAGNAIQLHGGIGFTWEYDTHLFFKRARSTINLLGHPQHHRERIASLIGLDAATGIP
ncbi:MAG: acyl-CoA dehydrogenase [Gammaproteobacteria bacterium]|nr:acyl-CoA dehydrogenase [Gammaproteobacteria bacterium]